VGVSFPLKFKPNFREF